MKRSKLAAATFIISLVVVTGSCDDEVTGLGTGEIQVSLTITGVDIDPDGGIVDCDGGAGRMLVPDVPVTFFDLSEGDHVLWLSDLSGHCSAAQNPRAVPVSSGETTQTTFAVTCAGPDPRLEVSKVAVAMVPGAWQTIEVWASDDEGAEEGWTAETSDGSVASISVSGSQVTVTGES
jgi:hypothetical protein